MPMKLSNEDTGRLLEKYISEKTPLLATLEVKDARVSISGVLTAGLVDDVPHLFVGNVADEFADSIQFRFVFADCEVVLGDLRDVRNEPTEDLADTVESFLTITVMKSSTRLGLIKLKNDLSK